MVCYYTGVDTENYWTIKGAKEVERKEGEADGTKSTTREGVVGCGQICRGLVSLGFIFHKLLRQP